MIFLWETKGALLEMLAHYWSGWEGWCNYLEGLFIPSPFFCIWGRELLSDIGTVRTASGERLESTDL